MKILATSGGFLPTDLGPYKWRRGPLIEHAIHLAGDPEQPRFCFVGTASGDSLNGTVGFYSAFAGSDVRASHLELFLMPNVADVRAHLLAQDVIWVNGGSVANLLAVWRTHGLDDVMRECWEAGVVLGGVSAGSICWYVGGTTDSFGTELRPVLNGLALLPYGNGVHYDSDAQRRPLLHSWSPRAPCRPRTPRTTVSDSSTRAPSWWRPSRTGRTPRRTWWNAVRTAPPTRPGSSPACSRADRGLRAPEQQLALALVLRQRRSPLELGPRLLGPAQPGQQVTPDARQRRTGRRAKSR